MKFKNPFEKEIPDILPVNIPLPIVTTNWGEEDKKENINKTLCCEMIYNSELGVWEEHRYWRSNEI